MERGGYLKKWKGKIPIALIYPNSYAVGMSSLGLQLVYSLLNRRDDVICERFFLPEESERPVSLESGRPLNDFPYIFISVSFEHDYLHIVKILLAGGIEPFAGKREERQEGRPLVVCGGVATFMNPEPIAPFVDFFLVGEAEPILDDFVDFLAENSGTSTPRQLSLEAVHKFEGVYAPGLYTPVYDKKGSCSAMVPEPGVPARVKRLSLAKCERAGHSELLTPLAEFSNLYLTELGRGCSRGCRFCAAGFIYRPPRLWDADAVIEGLKERPTEVSRVGLLGMEMAGGTTLDHISGYILESGCALSFSSLRADRINDGLLNLLSKSDLKSVAIAPDGASERLRRVINKGLDRGDLLTAAGRLAEAGIFKLKLYVMVGLPTETCEDLQEFIDLVAAIKQKIDAIGKKRGRLTEIYLSVNCFVPKPWTPFQYHPFGIGRQLENDEMGTVKEALTNFREKISYLKKGLKDVANVHFQADKPENALFQALLSRGDRRLADVLFDMAVTNMSWKAGLKKNELRAEWFISAGSDAKRYFPWYIIDHGIEHDYLWQEYLKGLRSASTEPCDTSICRRCGVCGER
ncbi:radical SAM protein [Desulfopila inferna]|uniref:radical SAM protein n=1 Tax=Desulfopila inferna TaxID=468528 RepID=UPI001F068C5D|nr:radical SAM protein [Desulfopila inferna]